MADPWDGRELWERGDGESTKAFEAFSVYRDMGAKRSTAKVARELGKSKTLMDRWSGMWQWVRRSDVWDAHVDEQAREEAADAVRRMHERHAQIAAAVSGRLIERLNALADEDVARLTLPQVAQILATVAQVERQARGEAASTIALQHSGETTQPDRLPPELEELLGAVEESNAARARELGH